MRGALGPLEASIRELIGALLLLVCKNQNFAGDSKGAGAPGTFTWMPFAPTVSKLGFCTKLAAESGCTQKAAKAIHKEKKEESDFIKKGFR
jgi:hypothetical protein